MARLLKRTTVETPKALPQRGKEEEPETTLCVAPEPEKVKNTNEKCSESCIFDAWRDGLCYYHWKTAQGLVYSEKDKRFIKPKEKK